MNQSDQNIPSSNRTFQIAAAEAASQSEQRLSLKRAIFSKKNAFVVIIALIGFVVSKVVFHVSFGFEMTFLGLLLIPILFAVATLADKFLVHGDEEDSNPGAIQAMGGVFSVIFMIPFGLWILFAGKSLGGWDNAILIIFIEGLQILSMFIYMTVLKDDTPSRVAPLWQIIPIYGAVGGIVVLNEIPTTIEWIGIALLVIGGIVVSMKKGGFSKKTLGLMALATIFIAVYEVYFAEFGRDIDHVSALFISLIGKAFWGFTFLVSKENRKGFVLGLRTKFKFQTITEVACTAADLGLLYFLLVFPVALVQAVCCLQPLFVLGGAVVLHKIFPKVMKEDVEGYTLKQKIIGTALVVIGGIILAVTLEA